jgi:hypothetical protein
VQRYDSAQPYEVAGSINTQPYLSNPGYLNPPSTVTYYFTPRGDLRWHSLSATDFSVNWSKRIPGLRTTEAFFRGVVTNAFNNAAVIAGNATVLTAASPGSLTTLQPFNPFTTQPVHGANWEYGPSFGQPNGVDNYQAARTFSFSVGVRF